jgi:2-desacetyl-2-hydroxyethyl bacteriochlorophyllide A dehydrogenase
VATARSLWFVGPRAVEIRTVPLAPPGDGEVVVRTAFSGISAGTELLAYRGQLDEDLPRDETIGALAGTFRYPFPYGYSAVGEVEQSGAGLVRGQLVFAFHPHQDRFVVGTDDVVVLEGVDPRRATMLPLVETALQIALDAGSVLEQLTVVVGAGAIGLLTALMLQRAGGRVLVVEPRPWRRELAEQLGAATADPDEAAGAIAGAGRPDGAALVVEASGSPDALAAALDLLAHEGTLLVASWYGTKPAVLPLGGRFHRRRLTIRSTQVSTIPARLSDRWDRRRRFEAAARLLRDLPLDALATHTFGFADAPGAYRAIDEGIPGLVHAALGYG